MNIVVIHEVGYLSKPVYEYQDFAERLAHLGHTVTVIDFDESVHTPFSIQNVSKTALSPVTLISLPNLGIPILGIFYARFRFRIEFKKLLKREKIDAVFLYSIFVNGVDAVKICNQLGIRVVFRAIDAYHRLRKSRWQSWLLKRGEIFVYKNADLLAVTNRKMEQYVRKIAGPKCVDTVLLDHGVDITHFKYTCPKNFPVNDLGIRPSDFAVVFLGTTYAFSQLDKFIRHIPEINRKISNFKLIIIGAGELDQNIAYQVHVLNLDRQVISCGMINYSNLPEYLSLAKLAILPFQINEITRDIIPIKTLQYLAVDLPVISTPLPDVMRNFPHITSGVHYSDTDLMQDFINALIEFFIKKANEAPLNVSRKFVSNHYSIDRTIKTLENILSGGIGG
jgi:glycosyltransferase involved in cell wall biosynthesis